jgi:hypothetical protein
LLDKSLTGLFFASEASLAKAFKTSDLSLDKSFANSSAASFLNTSFSR